jgi:hypothetical protein
MVSILHFVPVCVLSHSLCSHLAITLDSRKDRTEHLLDKGPKLPQTILPLQMVHPPDNNP